MLEKSSTCVCVGVSHIACSRSHRQAFLTLREGGAVPTRGDGGSKKHWAEAGWTRERWHICDLR